MKKFVAFAVVSFPFCMMIASCKNDSRVEDGDDGGSGGSIDNVDHGHCPNVGTKCYSEGSDCESGDYEVVCHCGEYVERDDAHNECDDNQNPDTCKSGMACGTEGTSCSGLKCHCGMWMSSTSAENINCPGDDDPNNPPADTSYTVSFDVDAYAYHVWCEGGFVEAYAADVSDTKVQWFGPWHSFGSDTFGPGNPVGDHPGAEWLTHTVSVEVPSNRSLRAQCYLNTNGTETSGDLIRYAFAAPTQLMSGESGDVEHDGSHVYPPEGQKAYLVPNLDPQVCNEDGDACSENLQVDP